MTRYNDDMTAADHADIEQAQALLDAGRKLRRQVMNRLRVRRWRKEGKQK